MFSVLSCLVLENAYKRGMPSIDIVSSNHSFAIDLKNMSQTNVATSETKQIQRIKSKYSDTVMYHIMSYQTTFISLYVRY